MYLNHSRKIFLTKYRSLLNQMKPILTHDERTHHELCHNIALLKECGAQFFQLFPESDYSFLSEFKKSLELSFLVADQKLAEPVPAVKPVFEPQALDDDLYGNDDNNSEDFNPLTCIFSSIRLNLLSRINFFSFCDYKSVERPNKNQSESAANKEIHTNTVPVLDDIYAEDESTVSTVSGLTC